MIHKIKMGIPSKYYVELLTDITFSQGDNDHLFDFYKQLKMDILLPKSDKPLPLIIFIDGGRFLRLNRTQCIPQLIGIAESGYVVASVEYRLSSEAKFPAQLEDVKTAVRFLRANANKYNIDPNRIGVWGKSAGATLASLLGTLPHDDMLESNGEYSSYSNKVHAVVSLFGVFDFLRFEESSSNTPGSLLIDGNVHKNKEKAAKVNAINYITKNTPPFLILHGDEDKVVPFNQSEILYNALKNESADVEFYKVKGAGHYLSDFTIHTGTLDLVQRFFDSQLKGIKYFAKK